jgi:hypothetical protein
MGLVLQPGWDITKVQGTVASNSGLCVSMGLVLRPGLGHHQGAARCCKQQWIVRWRAASTVALLVASACNSAMQQQCSADLAVMLPVSV